MRDKYTIPVSAHGKALFRAYTEQAPNTPSTEPIEHWLMRTFIAEGKMPTATLVNTMYTVDEVPMTKYLFEYAVDVCGAGNPARWDKTTQSVLTEVMNKATERLAAIRVSRLGGQVLSATAENPTYIADQFLVKLMKDKI